MKSKAETIRETVRDLMKEFTAEKYALVKSQAERALKQSGLDQKQFRKIRSELINWIYD